MRLQDRVAIITGGGSGLGRTTAITFAREGARVVLAEIDALSGTAAAAGIRQSGGDATFIKTDVTREDDVQNLVDRVRHDHGRIDVLVNNAGIVQDARLVKMSFAQWQQVLAVNLTGVFLCGQAVARVMEGQEAGGVILNASSVVGLYGNFGQSNYVATKAGVIGLTKTWARELGRKNIRVNAVAPGFIATEMVNTVPEKVLAVMQEKTALNRLGKPEDIANAYLFLASDEAAFITGAVLSVDGGLVV